MRSKTVPPHTLLYVVGIVPVGVNVVAVQDNYPLVKSSCHYNVADVYSIAHLTQDYESRAPIAYDVDYVFPLPPTAAVCAFKAVIDGDKVIKGVVREKKAAKKEYQAALAKGQTAGLLEKEHADG